MASSDAGRRLSLVLPAYNEEAGIRQAIIEADDALAALFDDYEILVVDDGGRDATAAVAAEEAAPPSSCAAAAPRREQGIRRRFAHRLRGGAV